MPTSLSGRHFLRLLDFSTEEIEYLLKLAKNFKDMKRAGVPHRYLEGKNIVLLFQKTSTRTRCAFEVGAMDLGMGVTYLDPGSSQMGKKESIEDTARVLGRFYDGIEFRGFAQTDVEELANNAGVPVWNGLTTEWHPTQMLADILTMQENFNYDIKGKTFVFMGDAANNVARSLMVVCSKLGVNFVACGPKENMPDAELIETCQAIAAENGSTVKTTESIDEAVTGAHVIYADVWVSMGEPDEVWAERIRLLEPYRVTEAVMAKARSVRDLPALPAVLPRHQHHHRCRHRRALRRHRDGGRGHGLRVQAVQGLRRGREPHAHHQGRHVRDPELSPGSHVFSRMRANRAHPPVFHRQYVTFAVY